MAKGARKTFLNTAAGIGQSAEQQQNLASSQGSQAYSAMMPQIYQMLSPSGDPAVTAATMGALGSSFGAAKQNAMDTAARTNNAASTNASLDQLARTEGATAAQTAAQNVASQHENATQLLAKIWGMDEDQVAKMLQERTAANASYGTQAKSSVLGNIFGAFGGALGGLGQAAKGGG
jgi:hypothetical protein